MAAVTKQMLQFQLSIIISKKKMRQAKADPGPVKMEGKEEGYISNLYIVICLHHDPYRGVVRLSNALSFKHHSQIVDCNDSDVTKIT